MALDWVLGEIPLMGPLRWTQHIIEEAFGEPKANAPTQPEAQKETELTPERLAELQEKANKILNQQKWTIVESYEEKRR